jgi:tRNA threonylcarbamoyladenosine biosynthesis protein TsaE
MTEFVFEAADEGDTDRLGAALAKALPPGTTVALCGTLGAGKTRLVQAIAAACGVDRGDVVSPTFVLCQKYEGLRTIFHLDAYRLRDEDEFRELGPEEYFESDGVTIIEWADKVAASLPDERIEIDVEVTGATARRFMVQAIGQRYESVISALSTHHSPTHHSPTFPKSAPSAPQSAASQAARPPSPDAQNCRLESRPGE